MKMDQKEQYIYTYKDGRFVPFATTEDSVEPGEKLRGGSLECVIRYGAVKTEYGFDKNKPCFYSDAEFKYCVKRYGLIRTNWASFKYGLRRKFHLGIWWLCHSFGMEIYSKEELVTAIYEACNDLRKQTKDGETLEEKIVQSLGGYIPEKRKTQLIAVEKTEDIVRGAIPEKFTGSTQAQKRALGVGTEAIPMPQARRVGPMTRRGTRIKTAR